MCLLPCIHRCSLAKTVEVGHTRVRCKAPPEEASQDLDNGGFGDNHGGYDTAPAAGGGDQWGSTTAAAGDDWETATPTPVPAGGDSSW